MVSIQDDQSLKIAIWTVFVVVPPGILVANEPNDLPDMRDEHRLLTEVIAPEGFLRCKSD